MTNVLEPTTTTTPKPLEAVARWLVEQNVNSEPSIVRFYWFPDASEVRLVGVDTRTRPTERIEPFYFRADPKNNLPYPMAIALITPENEASRAAPPSGWRDWSEAVQIWPEA